MLSIDFTLSSEPSCASASEAYTTLIQKSGSGNDYLGWLDLPVNYDKEEFAAILSSAERIKQDSAALVVIGIGGSYLGARAVIEMLKSNNYNQLPKNTPDIFFIGNSFSGSTVNETIQMLGDRDFSVNVISKSGTTTESSVAFRIFKELLEKKYGKAEAAKRIYATTDRARGALKTMADAEGYTCFVIPDDVGGRYSVLTAVGLLPIAVAGIDISELMRGAAAQRECCLRNDENNLALKYACSRQSQYSAGKSIEILANYEPRLHCFSEWWKQLYGESEGKDGIGIYPASVDLTTDLHSMGQYIQDGIRMLQETVLFVDSPVSDAVVPFFEGDPEGLNYLAGKGMSYINQKAMEATAMAHRDGNVPVTVIHCDAFTPFTCGELIYFFEFACGVSAYITGVNPFNQPGVEAYKKNMFHLLGKPGY